MPPPTPIARIEQVASELEQLARELEGPIGPEAETALMHWRAELLAAVEQLTDAGAGTRPA